MASDAERLIPARRLRIGWPWDDPEWPDLPPAVITTDRVKRDFDRLLVSWGLPAIHFPEPGARFADVFARIRSGVRVDKCEPLTEETFRAAVQGITDPPRPGVFPRLDTRAPQPATFLMSPGAIRNLQATAEHWRERERELNYELHRLARGWSKLRLLKRWRRYKQHHAAAGNARAFAPYLAARERFNV